MDTKPYTPLRLDNPATSPSLAMLTSRQRLAQVRKALAVAKDARAYWPDADWATPLLALERAEADLHAEIERTDAAMFGTAVLRPTFVNVETGMTARMIVRRPDDDLDMPHIDYDVYKSLRRCVGADGKIVVYADYNVYVVKYSLAIAEVIEKFDPEDEP